MARKKEDNVVFVLQKAIKQFKIKVTNTTVKEFLLAHPHYPSLKSVCDALKKWEVDHYALTLDVDEIIALDMPFIAHLKTSGGQIAFVEKIQNEQVTYFLSDGNGIKENFEKFSERLSGAVIVMDKNNNSGEKDYVHNQQNEFLRKSLLPIGILTLLVLAILNLTAGLDSLSPTIELTFWGLLACKIIGLTSSIFLVLHELKVHTPLADKICGFSSKTDCDTVLSSNASKLFGWVNWADTGLIFFTGSLIFLLGTPQQNNFLWMLAFISALSLPYPVFSIYYQSVKLKKWCPFCLTVQVILIAEFMLLLPAFKSVAVSGTELLRLIVSFLVPVSIWLIFKAYFNKYEEQQKEHFSFLQFKRNPKIFKYLLTDNSRVEIQENENSLILGNREAKVTITAFLSLYCNPCANAFKEIKNLLDNCSEIKVNAIFSVYDDNDSKELISTLYNIYNRHGDKPTVDFLFHWYSAVPGSRKELHEILTKENLDAIQQIKEMNSSLYERMKVQGTPTFFLNGYKFPTQYDYGDIEFYIDDIIQLTMESKRQEACTNCN